MNPPLPAAATITSVTVDYKAMIIQYAFVFAAGLAVGAMYMHMHQAGK